MIEENIHIIRLIFVLPLCIFLFQCNPSPKNIPKAKKGVLATPLIINNTTENKFLSQYGFFKGELADLKPNKDVFPYTLNTPLFSNYAYKKRFIYLPEGVQMSYKEDDVFSFENGSVLIKNFYYPGDFRMENGTKKIIETRLLIKENNIWKPLNYIWSEDQQDAKLNYVGEKINASWIHTDGTKKSTIYNIPNNTCYNYITKTRPF